MRRKIHPSGFTLVEIVIMIGILMLLMAVLFTTFSTSLKKSRDGRRKADLSIIKTALESYRIDYGTYPPNPNPGPPAAKPYEVPSSIVSPDNPPTYYLANTPRDPLYEKGTYYYCYVPASGNPILSYTLSAVFELEASSCPGQPTATPTPTPDLTITNTPTPTLTVTPTPQILPPPLPCPGGMCIAAENGNQGSCCTGSPNNLYPNRTCTDPATGNRNFNPVVANFMNGSCQITNCPSDPGYPYPILYVIGDPTSGDSGCSSILGAGSIGSRCDAIDKGCGYVPNFCVVTDTSCEAINPALHYRKVPCICL